MRVIQPAIDEEAAAHLKRVIDYLWESERTHFMNQPSEPSGAHHIFSNLCAVVEWFEHVSPSEDYDAWAHRLLGLAHEVQPPHVEAPSRAKKDYTYER